MRRFLMLLGVAAVAGPMYVAAAAGSQRSAQSAGPTAKQFAALKKQVAALQKKVKTVQNEADGEAAVLLHCVLAGLRPTGPAVRLLLRDGCHHRTTYRRESHHCRLPDPLFQ